MSHIKAARLRASQFQPDFIRIRDNRANLLNSGLRNLRMKTIIHLMTEQQVWTVHNIGNGELPCAPPGNRVQQELNRQRWLTSMYSNVKDP